MSAADPHSSAPRSPAAEWIVASSRWLAVGVLLAGLASTAVLYLNAVRTERQQRAAETTKFSEALRSNLNNRVQAYLDTLPGLRALCLLQTTLDDAQFERYIEGISLQKRFPGLAVTFIARHVSRENLAAFEREAQQDVSRVAKGHPGFKVYPAGERAEYMVLRHTDRATSPILAYDLYDPSERYRTDAVAAVLRGRAVATAPILLVNDRDKTMTPELTAVVVRLPVYRGGGVPQTEAMRQQSIWGLVGVSFRTQGLVQSLIAADEVGKFHIKIVDTQAQIAGVPATIFDSNSIAGAKSPYSVTSETLSLIDVAGRTWALHVMDEAPVLDSWGKPIPLVVMAAGIAISFLFAALTRTLVRANARAAKQVENATRDLIRNQRNLEEAQRLTRVGFYELNIETRVYTASPIIYEILGLDPAMGQVTIPQYLKLIHPDDLDRVNHNRELAISGGRPAPLEYRIIRPNGELRYLDGRGFVTFDEGGKPVRYSGALQDITDRKLAEEDRSMREALARLAGEVAQLGGWSMNVPPTTVAWSDQMCDIFEMPHGYVPAIDEAVKFYSPASQERLRSAIRECIATGKPYDLEHQISTATGKHKWIRSIAEAVRDGDKIVRVQGAVQDITSRKESELALASANRSLQMLTQCNEAIVRATTEQRLLDELCRIAVEIGGYRLAWVGYAQEDAQKSIVPKSFAGAEDGFLAKINLRWSEDDDGPASQSIRSGSPVVIADFNRVQRKLIRNAAVNEHRLPGVICLPLTDKTRTFGMLALYPTEVRELPEAEFALLRDLAENIAFGVVALRNRDAVLEREQRFKNLARATSDGVWDFDIATGKVWRNEGWANMFGFEHHEVISDLNLWANQIHEEDREPVLASFHSAIDGSDEVWASEYRMRHKNGSVLNVLDRAHIMRDDKGKAHRLVGGMSDLTKRVIDESRLREQAALLDQAGEAIFVRSLDHKILYWNKGAERLYGWTAEEAIGKSALQLTSIDPTIFQLGFEALLKNDEWMGEISEVGKNGQPVYVDARWTLVRDKHGVPSSVLAIHNDISDRRQTEALHAERDAAELANRSKSEFLARMSHELRTPLNSVLGFAQLLQKSAALNADAPAKKKVGYILEAGTHLVAMIDDILDLSKIESGVLSLSPEPINIAPVIQECIAQSAPQADHKQLTFQFHADGEPWILADQTRVRQVLLNLFSNSIKYNRQGGSVDVRLTRESDQVRIAIRDSGIGLTATQLESLFQPFNRLGAEVSGVEGTGIGLVIVRQLVIAMGGRIDVKSTPGEGSVFTLEFQSCNPPAIDASSPVEADTAAINDAVSSAQPLSSKTPRAILYVEDNPANVKLVEQVLASTPWLSLAIAMDGPTGVTEARKLRPDLILLDINLPGMDGFAVFDALRADPALANIPCIALSANAMSSEIQRAREAGFADYLTKPLNVESLMATIEGLLVKSS